MASTIKAALFATCMAASTGYAVASGPLPDQQRLIEMTAAGQSASARLGRQPADAIEYLSPDHFRVRIGPCWVDVRLADAPPPTPPSGRPVVATSGEPRCK